VGGAAWVAIGLSVLAGGAARSPRIASGLLAAAGFVFAAGAAARSPVLPVATGALFLGGITSEMMLGHWFLIDPRLPRWSLRALTAAGGVGLVLDVAYLATEGAFGWQASDAVMGWAFVVLAATSAVLVVGVWLALREKRYTGVMAATGLSYLATLTAFGAVVLGRLVAFPP
jgi:hypothetical protein